MILYLLRHGETDLNKQRRIQGQSDLPLYGYGRELAKVTGGGLRRVNFDAVLTSPLMREYRKLRLVNMKVFVAVRKIIIFRTNIFSDFLTIPHIIMCRLKERAFSR